mmetsp:Transcript_17398/g.37426  ORF Transcript_17398/g.37426 Transcript_17398/m.37426 type:complete len:197 (+) Transcript_17398:684-1274(+)
MRKLRLLRLPLSPPPQSHSSCACLRLGKHSSPKKSARSRTCTQSCAHSARRKRARARLLRVTAAHTHARWRRRRRLAAAAAAVAQGDAVAGVAAGVTLMDASTVANDGAEEVRPYTPIPWLYRNTHSPTRKDRILSRLQKQRAMKVANRGRPMSKEQKREWSRTYEAREAAARIEASKKRIAIAESKRRKAAAAAA